MTLYNSTVLRTQIIEIGGEIQAGKLKVDCVSDGALGEITVQLLSTVCVCVFYTELIYTEQVCHIGQTLDIIRLGQMRPHTSMKF